MADHKIATEKLYVGTALAHNVGDEVPAANVEANGWGDSVAGADTKAAKKAQESSVEAGPSTGVTDQA